MSELTPAPKRRIRRAAKVVLPSIAAAAVTAVGFAAFTDDARNAGNSASAASVTITEDVAAATPLFDLSNWQPAEQDTVSRCIAITNDGSIALPLSLRFDGAPTGGLGDYVDMKVERGTRDAATNSSDCSSFQSAGVVWEGELDEFPTTAAGRVSDKGAPLAVKGERAYKVTWKLQDDEGAEGKAISGVSFLWETTSAD
jgi:hypothetical protein